MVYTARAACSPLPPPLLTLDEELVVLEVCDEFEDLVEDEESEWLDFDDVLAGC